MPYRPQFTITAKVARALMQIESARQSIQYLPITPTVLFKLRETARLEATHYSTMIEGNRLTQEQVTQVVERQGHFPGRERDEREVLGYYAALDHLERLASQRSTISDRHIQHLHALVMAGGRQRVKPTPYRDGQNVIRDSRTRRIIYMPPEAGDVPSLMKQLIAWLRSSEREELPCPLRAAIAHYQFATIHPYYDGNGRTGRLLATLILHLGGFDLKGLYSLEEYYARRLGDYYAALTVGPSHNYYLGRADSDITEWVEYFCQGMAESFAAVQTRAQEASGAVDASPLLRRLDPRQRKALTLFQQNETITSRDIQQLFTISERTARLLTQQWTEAGFLVMIDPARKSRKYALAEEFQG